VKTTDGMVYDVMFVGTDRGQVLKMINSVDQKGSKPILIEELQVVPQEEPILNLQIIGSKLLVTTSDELLQLPLHRCGVALSCSACVRLQDPYCGWSILTAKCVSNTNFEPMYASEFLQNVTFGRHRQCGDSESPVVIEQFMGPQGSVQPGENRDVSIEVPTDRYTTEELCMAVATSVVCALILGFIAGFLAARYSVPVP